MKFDIVAGRIYFWLGVGIFAYSMLSHALSFPNIFDTIPQFIGVAFAGTTLMLIGTNILKNTRTPERRMIDTISERKSE